MDYETFKEEFKDDIIRKLAEHGMDDVSISFHEVEKANETYEAMSIRQGESNVSLSFNVESAFADYERSGDYDGLLASAAPAIADKLNQMPNVNVEMLKNYDLMKGMLSIEVINADVNAELLAKIPHEQLEDMAVVYRFVVASDSDARSSILVTNNMLNMLGITKEQLREDALENAPRIRPAVIQGMNEVMMEMMSPEDAAMLPVEDLPENFLYVASVPDRQSGAGVMAYQGFMDQAAERLGGDFYILPSSLHEIILVPDQGDVNFKDLEEMVHLVNKTEVDPKDRLSDSVYHYDSKDHIFELAEKFEARQLKKEAARTDEKSLEHGSVLKDLKDKCREASARPSVKDTVEKAAKSKGGEAL